MDKLVLLGIALAEGIVLLVVWLAIIFLYNRKLVLEARNRELMKRLHERNKEMARTVTHYEMNCFFLQEQVDEQEKALSRKDALLRQKWKNAKGQGDQT